jgi:hypothetical protein
LDEPALVPRFPLSRLPPADRSETPAPDGELFPLGRVLGIGLLALGPPARCWRFAAESPARCWRFAAESPRAEPPYWVAVALSEYGVPPRCSALCCQLPLPLRLTLVFLLVFRLKLLTLLTVTWPWPWPCPPQPQPQHVPPHMAAPTMTPTPNVTKAAPGV